MTTLVTVVHGADLPLLRLQARSLARFFPPEDISEILVLVNDIHESRVRDDARKILPEYGPHGPNVRILGGDDLLGATGKTFRTRLMRTRHRWPAYRHTGWRGNNGYRMQQAFKLAAARVATSDRILILDSKNVFIRPSATSDFFAPDGRPRMRFMPISADHHERWLRESLRTFDARIPVTEFTETVCYTPPFPIARSFLGEVLEALEARRGPVEGVFAPRRGPSEFMLINVWATVAHAGIRDVFSESPHRNAGFWRDGGPDAFERVLQQIDDPHFLSVGIHRKALKRLPEGSTDRVAEALARFELGPAADLASILGELVATDPAA